MKKLYIKRLFVSFLVFFLLLELYAQSVDENLDNTNSWYICKVSGNKAGAVYKGPYEEKLDALAQWYYEVIPEDKNFCIAKNRSFVTKKPSSYFSSDYNAVVSDFDTDREYAISKYKVIQDPKSEEKYEAFIAEREKIRQKEEALRLKTTYIKKIHPRIYSFDLGDVDSSVKLSFNSETSVCEYYFDLTPFVKNDLPQAGDQINLSIKGKASKDIETLYFAIVDAPSDNEWKDLGDKLQVVLVQNIQAGKEFSSKLSVILSKSAVDSFKIYLSYGDNYKNYGEKNRLKLVKSNTSTNTELEEKNEAKAVKAKFTIVEQKDDIVDTVSAAAKRKEAQRKKEEEERLRLEQERLEAERLEQERLLEEQRKQEELQKVLEKASQVQVSRYKKEYLQDFMLPEETENPGESKAVINKLVIDNPNEADENGFTLLMNACKTGNEWQIRTLLESGADVNAIDKDGWTPLMYAARYQDNLSVVDILLKSSCEVKVKNKFDTSALILAANFNNNPEILKILLSYYSNSEKEVLKAFTLLLSSNQSFEYVLIAKIQVFLEKNLPLNTFYEGRTPLMYAAQYGKSTKAIQVLLDNNCVTSIRSTEGKTAFDYAMENKNLKHDESFWALNNK